MQHCSCGMLQSCSLPHVQVEMDEVRQAAEEQISASHSEARAIINQLQGAAEALQQKGAEQAARAAALEGELEGLKVRRCGCTASRGGRARGEVVQWWSGGCTGQGSWQGSSGLLTGSGLAVMEIQDVRVRGALELPFANGFGRAGLRGRHQRLLHQSGAGFGCR